MNPNNLIRVIALSVVAALAAQPAAADFRFESQTVQSHIANQQSETPYASQAIGPSSFASDEPAWPFHGIKHFSLSALKSGRKRDAAGIAGASPAVRLNGRIERVARYFGKKVAEEIGQVFRTPTDWIDGMMTRFPLSVFLSQGASEAHEEGISVSVRGPIINSAQSQDFADEIISEIGHLFPEWVMLKRSLKGDTMSYAVSEVFDWMAQVIMSAQRGETALEKQLASLRSEAEWGQFLWEALHELPLAAKRFRGGNFRASRQILTHIAGKKRRANPTLDEEILLEELAFFALDFFTTTSDGTGLQAHGAHHVLGAWLTRWLIDDVAHGDWRRAAFFLGRVLEEELADFSTAEAFMLNMHHITLNHKIIPTDDAVRFLAETPPQLNQIITTMRFPKVPTIPMTGPSLQEIHYEAAAALAKTAITRDVPSRNWDILREVRESVQKAFVDKWDLENLTRCIIHTLNSRRVVPLSHETQVELVHSLAALQEFWEARAESSASLQAVSRYRVAHLVMDSWHGDLPEWVKAFFLTWSGLDTSAPIRYLVGQSDRVRPIEKLHQLTPLLVAISRPNPQHLLGLLVFARHRAVDSDSIIWLENTLKQLGVVSHAVTRQFLIEALDYYSWPIDLLKAMPERPHPITRRGIHSEKGSA